MNRYTLTNVLFSATLLAAITTMARGQQCPDWSPEFDQIDDPVALQQLQQERSEGWPNLNPQTNGGIGIQQGIQSLDQAIQQYQQELQQAQQAWLATRSNNAPMPKMNGTECRNSNNMGAAMAAACEVDNMHNAILAAQGTIDLARCRAGMPAVSHSSFDSMGSGTSYPGGGFGSYAASFDSGAASEAGLNVSRRSGMVNSVTKNWHPPVEQQQAQDSLAQSTTLADPFAEPEVSDGGTAASANQGTSGNVASSNASNSDDSATSASATSSLQSSDSSVADSGTGNGATSSTDVAAAMPSQAETSAVPDSGSANTAEGSVTPVAQMPEASNSSEIANSEPDAPPANLAIGDTSNDNSQPTAANQDVAPQPVQATAGNVVTDFSTSPSQATAPEGQPDAGPSDQQLSITDTVLSLTETSAQQIGSGIDDLKNSGTVTAIENFLSTEVEPSLSGAITDIGGVVISLEKGLLDPGVALGVKGIVDQANDPNKLPNTNEGSQMCLVVPDSCQPAPAKN